MHKMLCAISVISGFAALALLALAGPSYRLEWLDLGQAFGMMRLAVYLGIASVVMIVGYSIWRRPGGRIGSVLAFSALAGLCAAYIPLSQLQNARTAPPIHDISTDLEDPPAFVDIVPLRKDAPNPHEYAGGETAELQREAYPDIGPLILEMPPERVYRTALEVVESKGWALVSATTEGSRARIEAVDTTFWFGFKDDVVIRLRSNPEGTQTRVDLRSKSRVGKGDVGKNAERIRDFTQSLTQALGRN